MPIVLYRVGEKVASYYYLCSYYCRSISNFCSSSSSSSFSSSCSFNLSPSLVLLIIYYVMIGWKIYCVIWPNIPCDSITDLPIIMATFVTQCYPFQNLNVWHIWEIEVLWLKLWMFLRFVMWVGWCRACLEICHKNMIKLFVILKLAHVLKLIKACNKIFKREGGEIKYLQNLILPQLNL